jgi:hypothetical protein
LSRDTVKNHLFVNVLERSFHWINERIAEVVLSLWELAHELVGFTLSAMKLNVVFGYLECLTHAVLLFLGKEILIEHFCESNTGFVRDLLSALDADDMLCSCFKEDLSCFL